MLLVSSLFVVVGADHAVWPTSIITIPSSRSTRQTIARHHHHRLPPLHITLSSHTIISGMLGIDHSHTQLSTRYLPQTSFHVYPPTPIAHPEHHTYRRECVVVSKSSSTSFPDTSHPIQDISKTSPTGPRPNPIPPKQTYTFNPASPESVYNFNIVLELPPAPAALADEGRGAAWALRL